MCFLSYPQLHTLFYMVIILCCILYYPLLCSGDDVYVECPVFPQKWGLNEKKNSFRFSLGNSTGLELAHSEAPPSASGAHYRHGLIGREF